VKKKILIETGVALTPRLEMQKQHKSIVAKSEKEKHVAEVSHMSKLPRNKKL
jgi:hypothetical protein